MPYYPHSFTGNMALSLDRHFVTRKLGAMMRSISVPVGVFVFTALLLTACGGGIGLGGKSDEKVKQTVDLSRPNTPVSRATQVAWTAARAQFCAFGMNREKLKNDYLAFEASQGATPDVMQQVTHTYDITFKTFYARVREIPNYCSPKHIEEIRPDIKRHLAGDYTPSDKKPPPTEGDDIALPRAKEDAFADYDKDPAGHFPPGESPF
ncbi:MAG: hypothetical protein OEM91_02530 [Hyphomicrobiales bacterium]|nr:hypothetical protein [Hyphomicrobiales bacterium]